MSARYRTTSRHQWADERVRSLTVLARLAWAYATCNTHDHVSGIYVLSPAVACDDIGMTEVEWLACLRELGESGLAHYDPTHRVIWVRNMLWRQGGTRDGRAVSPKMLQSTEMHLRDLPPSRLKDQMVAYYAERYAVDIRALYAPQSAPVVLDAPETVVDLPDVDMAAPVPEEPRKVPLRMYQETLKERLMYGWDGRPPPKPLGLDPMRIHMAGSRKLHEAGVTVEMVLDTIDRWAAMLDAGETGDHGPEKWKGTYLFSGYFDSLRSAIKLWERKREKRRAAIVQVADEPETRLDPEAISRMLGEAKFATGVQ